MSKPPVQFDELYRNLVRAGESSGSLETVLETIADYKENIETIKGKIKKAMFYLIAIIGVAILVCGILMVYVVPIFKEQFASFGADLPAFTDRKSTRLNSSHSCAPRMPSSSLHKTQRSVHHTSLPHI